MSKFKMMNGSMILRRPDKSVKLKDMQIMYNKIKDRDPMIFIGVHDESVTSQNFEMVSDSFGKFEKIIFNISDNGHGITFPRLMNALTGYINVNTADVYLRINNEVHKVTRLVDDFNVITMEYQ